MTYIDSRSTEATRETRTPVRLPEQSAGRIFHGWGPKF
jgi:hypothetical protein